MQKFCFVCGKKIEELIEGYCKECYEKKSNAVRKTQPLIRRKQPVRHPDYYEAILQLRGFKEVPEILKVFRIKEVKGGTDIYVESKLLAGKLVKRIRKTFPVQIKRSFRLWGRKHGRNIYKNIISIRKLE